MGIYNFVPVPVQCKHLHTILSKIFFLGQCEHILWRDAHRGSTPVLAVEENLCYRPQRCWGKVIFSEACVKNSVHRQGCLGSNPSSGSRHPPPPWNRHPGSRPPRSSACWEIRATSRRYASYWNACILVCNHFRSHWGLLVT